MQYELSKTGKLILIDRLGRRLDVGTIKDNCFTNTDQDNYHKDSRSLGIDSILLISRELVYKYITFTYYGKVYTTTRFYFNKKGVERDILNTRKMLFVPINDIYLSKAIKYEQVIKTAELGQMSIFDVFLDPRNGNNNALLSQWEEAINK